MCPSVLGRPDHTGSGSPEEHPTMKTIPTTLALAGLAATGLVALSGTPATAAGGAVTKQGSCSAASTWKLKVKTDDAGLEVGAEVDSNVVGQTWNWTLSDNGNRVAKGSSVTTAPSGSFTVDRIIPNLAGP